MKKELIRTERYIHIFDEAGKQLAHLPLNDSPTLEGVPLLPPIDEQSINTEIAVKELLGLPTYLRVESMSPAMRRSFDVGVEAYNKAREKYKFTEEDMINFACKVYNENYDKDDSFFTTAEALIKSFSQPKTPTHFEFEIESKSVLNLGIELFNPNTHVYTNEPKTTTNSQGQVVACGKYIY